MASDKHILIIGSNSFSGASFAAYARRRGWRITAVSRSPEPNECYLPYKWGEAENEGSLEFHQLNIRDDAAAIADLVREKSIPYVVNFAALGMVAESWLYPLDYYNTNLLGNVALHESLRKVDCLERYLHISTPEVYGDTEGLVQENAPLNPTTPYAASRAACDIHLKTFLKEYDFPVIWTRAANVFGPGQQPFRIIPRTILCARLGERLKLHGGGGSVRSFIHINDVAEATLRIMTDGVIGSTYHISTDRFLSIKELAQEICRQLDIELETIAEIAPERAGKDQAYFLDSSRCRDELDWSPATSLESGIRETIAWVDHWLETLKTLPLGYEHKA